MECFNSFKDYLELSFPRGDEYEDVELPMSDLLPDSVDGVYGHNHMGWSNNDDMYKNEESPVPGTGINSGCTGMLDWHTVVPDAGQAGVGSSMLNWHTAVPDAGQAGVGSGMLDWHTAVPDAGQAGVGSGSLDWHTAVPDAGQAGVGSSMLDWLTDDIPDRKNNDSLWQRTPDSSSGESGSARPVLGRRNSADVDLLQPRVEPRLDTANRTLPEEFSSTRSPSVQSMNSIPKVWDHELSSTSVSNGRRGPWGKECGAWTDLNAEINTHSSRYSIPVNQASGSSTPTVCNGNSPSTSSVWNGTSPTANCSNGLFFSTGFYAGSGLDTTANVDSSVSSAVRQPVNDEPSRAPFYPLYSNGFNVEYPEAIGRVAILLNKLMKQGSVSVGNAEGSGYRNFRSLDEGKFCAFCKRNKERREFYTTHVVKDSWGNVICPILRKYVCPVCGATGDGAHTIRHCPMRSKADTN